MPDAKARGWGDPSAKGYRAEHIVGVQAAGMTLYVRREVAHLFMGFLQEIVHRGYQLNTRKDDWGFIVRPVRGYEDRWAKTHDTKWLSNHSWGLAIDLDATDHPMGTHKDFPPWVVDCAHKWGLSWGGDYANRPDPMHFEFLGTPADVAKYPDHDHPIAQRPPLPAPTATDYPEDIVRRLDLAIETDHDGRGYRDLDVKALDVVSVISNTANPPDSGYKPLPDVARLDVAGKARIVVEEALPDGRIDVSVWVAG